MDVVEIIVFMTVALAVSMMVIAIVTPGKFKIAVENVREMVTGRSEKPQMEVDADDFVLAIYQSWENSNYGQKDDSLVLFVKGSSVLNKAFIFDKIKELSLCSTFQSANYGCGNEEHLVLNGDIELPAVVKISIDKEKGQMIIS